MRADFAALGQLLLAIAVSARLTTPGLTSRMRSWPSAGFTCVLITDRYGRSVPVDQPCAEASHASASASIRIAAVIAPVPPGVYRSVSSAFNARSAAARDLPLLATSRTRPS